MGLMAATGDLSEEGIRRAAVLGSVMGSFTVEKFSLERLLSLTNEEVRQRFHAFGRLTQFTGIDTRNPIPWRT